MIMELEYMELMECNLDLMECNMDLMQRIMDFMERNMEIRSIHHMYPHINLHMVVVVECFHSSMGIHSSRHLRILLRHQLDILIKLQ